MNKIVEQVLGKYLDDGIIKIDSRFSRVFIDIGTSFNAPNTEVWTRGNEEVFVIAVEPNPKNVESLKYGNWLQCPYGSGWKHELQLNPNMIDNQVYLLEAALSSGEPRYSDFYCTDSSNDPGCSSLYKPMDNFSVALEEKISVPTFSLMEIMKIFPWDKFPFIEHLKIDAQSSDYDIILGMGEYLKRVLYLTVETHTIDSVTKQPQYHNSNENPDKLKSYIEDNGFVCKKWGDNAYFYNKNLREYWEDNDDGFEFFNCEIYYHGK